LAAIEQNLAQLTPPDEMAEALDVGDPAPPMSVQRHDISRRDAGMKNAHPLVFEQQLMMGWRCQQRVERVRPRPLFRVLAHVVLRHRQLLVGDLTPRQVPSTY